MPPRETTARCRDDGQDRKSCLCPGFAQKRDVWLGSPAKKDQNRSQSGEQYSLQDSEEENGAESYQGRGEIDFADAPHASERGQINQPEYRSHDDCCKNCFRQICEQSSEEQQADGERKGGKYQCQWRASASLIIDGRLRQSARDRISVAKCDREVGRADAQEFLTRVETIAVLGRECSCRGNAFDIGQQKASGGERKNAIDVAPAQLRP